MSEISGGNESNEEIGGLGEAQSSNETGAASGEIGTGGELAFAGETENTGKEVTAGDPEGLDMVEQENSMEIDGFRSTEGMNQILETPETLEEAQTAVETFHRESIDQILESNGTYFSEDDRERVEQGADQLRAIEHDPWSGRSGAYWNVGGKSHIEVSAIDRDQMERTTKHETNHFASKNREIIVPDPERNGYTVYQTVGLRRSSWFHSNETGQESEFQTSGRGLNEGITTLFTNEQLSALSPEKGAAAEREGVYAHATEVCMQLQETLGKDAIAEAYYGGKTMELQEKMDTLGGKGTFEQFQQSLDKTISRDYAERVQGMQEAQEILARLDEMKGGKAA